MVNNGDGGKERNSGAKGEGLVLASEQKHIPLQKVFKGVYKKKVFKGEN